MSWTSLENMDVINISFIIFAGNANYDRDEVCERLIQNKKKAINAYLQEIVPLPILLLNEESFSKLKNMCNTFRMTSAISNDLVRQQKKIKLWKL